MAGKSMVPLLSGKSVKPLHRYTFAWGTKGMMGIRDQKYKYITADDKEYLYDMNLNEQPVNNISDRYPELLASYRAEIRRFIKLKVRYEHAGYKEPDKPFTVMFPLEAEPSSSYSTMHQPLGNKWIFKPFRKLSFKGYTDHPPRIDLELDAPCGTYRLYCKVDVIQSPSQDDERLLFAIKLQGEDKFRVIRAKDSFTSGYAEVGEVNIVDSTLIVALKPISGRSDISITEFQFVPLDIKTKKLEKTEKQRLERLKSLGYIE